MKKSFLFDNINKLKTGIENNAAMINVFGQPWASNGKLVIRRYEAPVPYGLVFCKTRDGTCHVWVKLLSYKTPPGQFLVIQLNSHEHVRWAKFFGDQFQSIWAACQDEASTSNTGIEKQS